MVPSCWSCVGKRALAELSTRVINTQTDRHTDHVHVMRPKRRKTATKKISKRFKSQFYCRLYTRLLLARLYIVWETD